MSKFRRIGKAPSPLHVWLVTSGCMISLPSSSLLPFICPISFRLRNLI